MTPNFAVHRTASVGRTEGHVKRQMALVILVVGLGVLQVAVGAVSIGVARIGAEPPSISAPSGAPLIIPAFMDAPGALVLSIPPVLYWLLVWPVLLGKHAVPRASLVAFALLCLLSIAWFVAGWRGGIRYEGRLYTIVCFALNTLLATVAFVLAARGRRSPTLFLRLSSHWVMVAWFVTYGFAYLGETP